MAGTQEGKPKQVLVCASAEQLEAVAPLFPSLEPRYVNGGDWKFLEGRRAVVFGWHNAHFASAYAEECVVLPDEMPEDFGGHGSALRWAQKVKVPYEQGQKSASPQADDPSPDRSPESADGASSPLPPPVGDAPVQEALESRQEGAEPPYDWEAYHATDTLESLPEQSMGWIGPEAEDMGVPADLWGHDDALPVIPPECYPDAIAAYVADEAEVMGCDPGMLALYCIAICAGCVSDQIRVQVKASSDRWQESARAWLMIVGDSGLTMKSPTLDAAVSHAWKIERELRVNGGAALKDYAREVKIYETQEAEYVRKRAKGEVAEMPVEPALPIAERLIIGNATLEAIGDVLLQQGERGALVLADELLGIIAGMNQYKGGKGSDRADWLELWNGGPHPIDRKGRAVLVKNWGVSIVGGTQPEAIARIGQNLETDGLLQRFTIYLPRYSDKGADRPGNLDARRRYHEVLDRLFKLVASPDLAPVRFSPGAAAVMDSARDWIMREARGSWMPAGLRSHLAKWPAMLARYCLVYAAIEAADEHHAAVPAEISERIALQAWTMMHDYLWPHAKHFYVSTLSGSGNRAALRQVAGLILAERLDSIGTRNMTQRSSIYRASDQYQRRNIIGALCELGWLSPASGKSMVTGLPTRYRVNDRVHAMFAERAEQERAERAERTNLWAAAKLAKREPGSDDE